MLSFNNQSSSNFGLLVYKHRDPITFTANGVVILVYHYKTILQNLHQTEKLY